jgi:hypothetical protein
LPAACQGPYGESIDFVSELNFALKQIVACKAIKQ